MIWICWSNHAEYKQDSNSSGIKKKDNKMGVMWHVQIFKQQLGQITEK